MESNESSEKHLKSDTKKWGWKRLLQKLGLRRFILHSFETEEDIHRLIDEGEEEGIIEEDEHDLIHSVFEFGDTIVREVMVPRVEISALPLTAAIDDALDLIIKKGHSRIPVYDKKIDDIVGVIYAKDLLEAFKSKKIGTTINNFMRPPFFVPETMKIMELLKEFQKKKIHMAIVVDEYGGTAGLVTIEDLLEELVGEIQDEYDIEKKNLVILGENSISVDAHINIYEIEEYFNCNLPQNDFETVGGLLFHLFERIPKEGEEITLKGLRFLVTKADNRRVWRVEISKVPNEEELNSLHPPPE